MFSKIKTKTCLEGSRLPVNRRPGRDSPLSVTGLSSCPRCCCWVASAVSDSVRPHRRQPARLPRPWDSPGKNPGVGCHLLLQCVRVKRESEVAQSCPTLREPMEGSLPGSSVYGIFQARVLEWGAMAFSGSCLWHVSKGIKKKTLRITM